MNMENKILEVVLDRIANHCSTCNKRIPIIKGNYIKIELTFSSTFNGLLYQIYNSIYCSEKCFNERERKREEVLK